ncbi:hypothetical protein Tco_0682277 [Tanacetum coccineum]|uniref:Uncharacterized protein n=1 Tax=Tanacetum coccineum TaxID=301880 RepID=A0ABQ4XQP8_9ASTR
MQICSLNKYQGPSCRNDDASIQARLLSRVTRAFIQSHLDSNSQMLYFYGHSSKTDYMQIQPPGLLIQEQTALTVLSSLQRDASFVLVLNPKPRVLGFIALLVMLHRVVFST